MRKRALGCVSVICGLAVIATVLWLWHPVWFRYQRCITYGYTRWLPTAWYAQDLRSSDPKLRRSACRVLGRIGGRGQDVSELLAPMLRDPNANVRGWAVEGLYQTRQSQGRLEVMSDRELVKRLGNLVYDDPSRRVRNRASGALLMLLRRKEVSDPELKATIEHILAEARSKKLVEKAPMP